MTIPGILLGSIVALFLGALFHVWRNGGFFQLIVYLVASLIGFWVGHGIAAATDLNFLSYGPLRLGSAILGSILFLVLAFWLSLNQDTYS